MIIKFNSIHFDAPDSLFEDILIIVKPYLGKCIVSRDSFGRH